MLLHTPLRPLRKGLSNLAPTTPRIPQRLEPLLLRRRPRRIRAPFLRDRTRQLRLRRPRRRRIAEVVRREGRVGHETRRRVGEGAA